MKKIACIVFELNEGEDYMDFVRKLEELCEKNVISSRVRSANIKPPAWQEKFEQIMAKLGITKTYKGYIALQYMMEVMAKEPEQREYIYLEYLYKYVTEKTGELYPRVERRIRTVVEKVYENNPASYVNSVLNIHRECEEEVTNSYFIAALTKALFG